MPEKLMRCIDKVMESGKSESDAWAICQKSTGLKPHKEKSKRRSGMFTQEQVQRLIALANKLDEQGLHKEADRIDGMIKEAGVGDWLTGLWNAIKGNPQLRTEVTDLHKAMQKVTFDLKEAVGKVTETVGTLEKLTQKPQLQHMAKWAELVKSMGEEIKITIQAAKQAAGYYEDFSKLSQKSKALSEGREQPGVSGMGSVPEESAAAKAGPQRPTAVPENLWKGLNLEQQKLWAEHYGKAGTTPPAGAAA